MALSVGLHTHLNVLRGNSPGSFISYSFIIHEQHHHQQDHHDHHQPIITATNKRNNSQDKMNSTTYQNPTINLNENAGNVIDSYKNA